MSFDDTQEEATQQLDMISTASSRLGLGSPLYDVLGMPIYNEMSWQLKQPHFKAATIEFELQELHNETFSMLIPKDACLANVWITSSQCFVFPEINHANAHASAASCFLLKEPYASAMLKIFPPATILRSLVYRKRDDALPTMGLFDLCLPDTNKPLEERQQTLWQYTEALREYNNSLDVHWVGHWSCCKSITNEAYDLPFEIAGHAALHFDNTEALTLIKSV